MSGLNPDSRGKRVRKPPKATKAIPETIETIDQGLAQSKSVSRETAIQVKEFLRDRVFPVWQEKLMTLLLMGDKDVVLKLADKFAPSLKAVDISAELLHKADPADLVVREMMEGMTARQQREYLLQALQERGVLPAGVVQRLPEIQEAEVVHQEPGTAAGRNLADAGEPGQPGSTSSGTSPLEGLNPQGVPKVPGTNNSSAEVSTDTPRNSSKAGLLAGTTKLPEPRPELRPVPPPPPKRKYRERMMDSEIVDDLDELLEKLAHQQDAAGDPEPGTAGNTHAAPEPGHQQGTGTTAAGDPPPPPGEPTTSEPADPAEPPKQFSPKGGSKPSARGLL